MTLQQTALNAAHDARLIANAIACGPTEAAMKAAELSARRLADTLPVLLQELAERKAAAREVERRRRRDQRIVQRDSARIAERRAAAKVDADLQIPVPA